MFWFIKEVIKFRIAEYILNIFLKILLLCLLFDVVKFLVRFAAALVILFFTRI